MLQVQYMLLLKTIPCLVQQNVGLVTCLSCLRSRRQEGSIHTSSYCRCTEIAPNRLPIPSLSHCLFIMFSGVLLPNFSGCLEEFDDGHIPETFRFIANERKYSRDDADADDRYVDTTTPRIVRYNNRPSSSNSVEHVHIYNDVLRPHHAQMLYDVTTTRHDSSEGGDDSTVISFSSCPKLTGESPWGTYVTVKEAADWINFLNETNANNSSSEPTTYNDWRETLIRFYKWQEQHKPTSSPSSSCDEKKVEQSYNTKRDDDFDLQKNLEGMETIRHALAVEAVAKFFLDTAPSSPGHFVASSSQHCNHSLNKQLYTKSEFLNQAHGVAVWALSSTPGCSVQYHIDYAEMLRYEYNVTVPPLWAGTIQCSPIWNGQSTCDVECAESTITSMVGGEFCVNLRGLEHYAEHGYKGMLSGDPMGGWRSPAESTLVSVCGAPNVDSSNKWVTIPYAFNRGIVHNGDLPHLSAPIKLIGDSHITRVIIGFNVFCHDVGGLVAKAPEHSKQFQRKVKLYRTTLNVSVMQQDDNCKTKCGINLSRMSQNKGLTKLLILAKRERVKEQLRRDQKQLTRSIWNRLLSHHASNEKRNLCVGDIVDEFGIPNDILGWPTPVDAHVHIHNMLRKQACKENEGKYHDVDGIAGVCGAYYTMTTVDDIELSSSTQKNDQGRKGILISSSTAILVNRCEIDSEYNCTRQ
jgi:hypothetical protein